MITIQIIGLYLITVTMLVKSECEMKISNPFSYVRSSYERRTSRPTDSRTIKFIKCENIAFNEEPLFPFLLNHTTIIQEFPYAKVDAPLLSTVSNITLVNSDVTLNSKTFQNFTNLNILNLISNNLSTFDIAPILSVRNLDLSNNSLTSLNNTNFKNFSLSSLNASYNQLSSIYCLNVSTEINLSHNQLNDSCKFYPSIEFINLSHNNINSISHTDFINLTNLRKLDLSYNYIDYVDSQLEFLKELQTIDLSHNNIKDIYSNCFEGLESLMKLDLSYNQIEKIDHGATNNLQHLRYLDLSYNNIYYLDIGAMFYPMEKLNELKLVGNFLTDLDVETISKLLKNLEYISLSFSQISCNKLMHYISDLKKYNIWVSRGPIVNQHNVHGILCTPLNITSTFKNNFEYAAYTVKKVHSLFVAITVLFVIILSMLFVINYYRYKSLRRF